ncbi:VOC family protein [Croceicoccus sp. Ery5]|uniref:VOC family protein n=1 Tax=Croceicoccus sp. Ery5 TaxID=1703340 RepID=UPI001E2B554F|nr:VOC family protein [Croceicoccus sp. Ery5]
MADIAHDPASASATVCLWFDGEAEAAAHFYAATFPDSAMGSIQRASADFPGGKEGDVLVVTLKICGLSFLLLNGGPAFRPNESFSLQIHTDTQEETDRLWTAITGFGGQESACGWCKDRWGYSWQITPRALTRGMADPDPAAAKRVMEAMMTMGKIDIAAIESARRG